VNRVLQGTVQTRLLDDTTGQPAAQTGIRRMFIVKKRGSFRSLEKVSSFNRGDVYSVIIASEAETSTTRCPHFSAPKRFFFI